MSSLSNVVSGVNELREPTRRRVMPAAPAAQAEGSYDRMAEVRVLFKSLDIDGSGSINASELHALMRTVGVHATVADVAALLADVDTDGSGDISSNEFFAVMDRRVSLPFSAAEVREAFAVLAGADAPPGCIQADVIKTLLLRQGPLYLPGPAAPAPGLGGRSGPGGPGGRGPAARGKAAAGGKPKAKPLPPMPGRGVAPPPGTPEVTPARVAALVDALNPNAAGWADYDVFITSLMPPS
jgi:hypothetical protein